MIRQTVLICLALLATPALAEEKLSYFDNGAVASRAQMRDGKANGLHIDY